MSLTIHLDGEKAGEKKGSPSPNCHFRWDLVRRKTSQPIFFPSFLYLSLNFSSKCSIQICDLSRNHNSFLFFCNEIPPSKGTATVTRNISMKHEYKKRKFYRNTTPNVHRQFPHSPPPLNKEWTNQYTYINPNEKRREIYWFLTPTLTTSW